MSEMRFRVLFLSKIKSTNRNNADLVVHSKIVLQENMTKYFNVSNEGILSAFF